MAKDRKDKADDLAADDTGGWLTSFLADEDSFDKRALWRLGSWGMAAVAAVTISVLANKSYVHVQRDQFAAADLERQSRQIQRYASEAQTESKRLSSAVETLNTDRDRLYSRVMTLEQGLDSVTGSIARQAQAPSPAPSNASAATTEKSTPRNAADSSPTVTTPATATIAPPSKTPSASAPKPEKTAAPSIAPASSIDAVEAPRQAAPMIATASQPLAPTPSILAPPDAAATKLLPPMPDAQPHSERAAANEPTQALAAIETGPEVPVQRTEFGVDLGGANSIEGLRTLWRRVSASNKEIAGLRPIISVQERHAGAKLRLRLVAGPLDDAAAAAKICAAMTPRHQACETSVFDGQRLALNVDPAPAPRVVHRRTGPRPIKRESLKPVKPAAPAAPSPAR